MDNSWLFDDEVDNQDAESDVEEAQDELESRLYAIIHHNDLSQPLPPSLAKHYSISRAEDGELEVTLKHSLEEVKNEEINSSSEPNTNFNENTLNNDESCEIFRKKDDDEDVIVISEVNLKNDNDNEKLTTLPRKRFRYSDVQVDNCQLEENGNFNSRNVPNFFNVGPALFKNKNTAEFSKFNLPSTFEYSDWKNDANSSYISIDDNSQLDNSKILQRMTQALVHCNPGVKRAKLAKFALLLYKRNLKIFKKRQNKKLKNTPEHSTEQNLIVNNTNEFAQELKKLRTHVESEIREFKKKAVKRNKNISGGSISLNISSFKPAETIDLVSDEESEANDKTTTSKTNTCDLQLPLKWNKKMAKFYTKPDKRKMNLDLDAEIKHLKRTTNAADWNVDPRDKAGIYQRSPTVGKRRNVKCANCMEKGHMKRECPKPLKPPACILCGQFYHTHYSCPNKLCMKCGVMLQNDCYNGECLDCYYLNFNHDASCEICGSMTHKTDNCTDLWRSFHATTEGEKKIPNDVKENSRKFCCNCSNRGHFSEDCPFPQYSGQQMSAFVSNYSCKVAELGTAEIVFPYDYLNILNDPQTDAFLQDLSENTRASITYNERFEGPILQIEGTFDQCKKAKNEIETYINTKKRKFQEPFSRRKRQRIS